MPAGDVTSSYILRILAETKDFVKKSQELIPFFELIEKHEAKEHLIKVLMATDATEFQKAMDTFLSKTKMGEDEAIRFKNLIVDLGGSFTGLSAAVSTANIQNHHNSLVLLIAD